MKRVTNLNAPFVTLIFVLLFTLPACKKDAVNNDNLVGKWQATIPRSTQKSTYEFKSDRTYEHTLHVIDTVTKKDLGIIARETGKYKISNAKLGLYDMLSYLNKDNKPGTIDDLKAIEGLKTYDYDVAITNGNRLTLNHQCGANELCTANYVPPFYYVKQ
jgi:hypothetical protein